MCQLNSDSFSFDCIGISENYQTLGDTGLSLNGYHDIITRCRDDGPKTLYILGYAMTSVFLYCMFTNLYL